MTTYQQPSEPFDIVRPTDFEILWLLRQGQQLTSPIIADCLDKKTDYVSARLGTLSAQGLTTSIYEVTQCNVFRITPIGAVALAHADKYTRKHKRPFTDLSGRVLSYLFATQDTSPEQVAVTPTPRTWHPMMIVPSRDQLRYLSKIQARQPVTQQDLFESGDSLAVVDTHLYALNWYGVARSIDTGYIVTECGKKVLDYTAPADTFEQSDYTYLRLQAQLETTGVTQVPDWYEPTVFTDSALSSEFSTDVPDFN